MTDWHDPAIVNAENGSLTFSPRSSLFMRPCFSVVLTKLIHAVGGVYM